MTKRFLTGNQAFGLAALEAGVRVAAGYPGTPSSELIETIAEKHSQGQARGVHVEWSTNEKAALELLSAASYAGARGVFTCKQVGLNVASDPLMSLNYVGTGGGLVLFVADDPGPISSQTEQDTRRFATFAKVPVLDPATPDQGYDMMKAAFDLSERYHTPVIVRPTTRICHASTFFDVPDSFEARQPEGFVKDDKWVIFPRRAKLGHAQINHRLGQISRDFSTDDLLSSFNPSFEGGLAAASEDDLASAGVEAPFAELYTTPRLGIVAGGISASYVREALSQLEELARAEGFCLPAYRFIQVGTPYPFPEDLVADWAQGLGSVIVFEELDHVLEDEMLKLAGKFRLPYDVFGKLDGSTRTRCENDVTDILQRISLFFDVHLRAGVSLVPWRDPEQGEFHVNFTEAVQKANAKAEWLRFAEIDPNDRPFEAQENRLKSQGAERLRRLEDERLADDLAQNRLYSLVRRELHLDEAAKVQESIDPLLAVRPPILCAGCPHRGAFYAVKRAAGKRSNVRMCGDIGCYTLGNAQPLDAVDTCLCMGAGITQAQGFATVEPGCKAVAFVGDSTFFASGMTGVANAVYNQHDVTICVLDNATTAMTGSQPHPGTGNTLMGPKTKPISIEAVLRALGVECVVRANPLYLDESIAAAKKAIDFDGPSAVIFQSPCTALILPDEPVVLDDDACSGCKLCCSAIGCPALSWDYETSRPRVDESLCVGCGLCADLCRHGALSCPGRVGHSDDPRYAQPVAYENGIYGIEPGLRQDAPAAPVQEG